MALVRRTWYEIKYNPLIAFFFPFTLITCLLNSVSILLGQILSESLMGDKGRVK